MPRSCSPICCFRSRRWAWDCAMRRAPARLAPAQPRDLRAAARRGRAGARTCEFQAEALRCCARACRRSCALIGFVGGPFTLYAYAVAGSHEGFARGGLDRPRGAACMRASTSACASCWPPTWRCRREAGADCVAIFDTAAGTLEPEHVCAHAAAPLRGVLQRVSRALPGHAGDLLLARYRPGALGGAARRSICSAWASTGGTIWSRSLQHCRASTGACRATSIRSGCCCRPRELESRLRALFARVLAQPAALRAGWVCGLGHGVLQHTPEDECASWRSRSSGRCSHECGRWPIR